MSDLPPQLPEEEPSGDNAEGAPRPRIASATRALVMLAAVLLVAAGVTPLVIRSFDRAPTISTGDVPDGYALEVSGNGDTVDLASVGMARLGGTVDQDVARVIVEIQGQEADALIDRSVDPAVWWVNTAAPATGTYEFDVTAVGGNGRLSRSQMSLDFVFPGPEEVVTSQEAVVLGSKGAPTLKSYDAKTGEVALAGVKRGQVREGVYLVSDVADAAPAGLLRRVETEGSASGDVTVMTSQARLDEVIFQAKIEDSKGGAGQSVRLPGSVSQSFDAAVGVPKGTKPEGGIKALRESSKQAAAGKLKGLKAPQKLNLAKGLVVRFGVAAGVSAELDLELRYRKVWFFEVPTGLDHLDITVSANGTLVAELGGDGPTDPSKPDKSALAQLLAAEARRFEKEANLFEVDMPPVSFAIGPIPVVINGSLEAEAFANAQLVPKSVLAASTGFELGATASVTRSRATIDPIHEAKFFPEYALGIAGSASIGVKLEPGLEAYGTLGVGVLMSTDITGTFNAVALDSASEAGPGIDASLALNLGVGAQAEVEILSFFEKEWESPLKKYPIYSCSLTFYPAFAPGSVDCDAIGTPTSGGSTGSGGGGVDPGEGSEAGGDALTSIIVLDTSSSMSESDNEGKLRIEGAREAVADYLREVPNNARVGLRSYPEDSDCGSGTLLIPPQRVDRSAINSTVAQLEPDGNTPTHIALQAGLDDLPDSGFRTLILVSDGEANCGGEGGVACDVARDVAASGVELTVNTVGFQISSEGQQELECISQATKGSYKTVEDGAALAEELNALTEPRLTVALDVPDEIQLDASGVPAEPVEVSAVVNNVGGRDAKGVSLALRSEGGPGMDIPDAGQLIGNIRAGERRTASWEVDPAAAAEAFTAQWTAAATADAVEPVEASAETPVVVPGSGLGAESAPILADASRVAIVGDGGLVGATASGGCDADEEVVGALGSDSVFGERVNLSCRGAATAQIASGPESQARELQRRHDQGAVGAVLMNFGSADVGMPELLRRCVAGNCDPPPAKCDGGGTCDDPLDFEARLLGLQRSGMATLASIDAATGSSGVPLLVMAYPRLFPQTGRSRDACTEGGSDSLDVFNARTERLNDTLAELVRRAASAGLPVRFVQASEGALAGRTGDDGSVGPGRTACERRALVSVDSADGGVAVVAQEGFGTEMTRALLADAPDLGPVKQAERQTVDVGSGSGSTLPATNPLKVEADGFAAESTVEVLVGEPAVKVGELQSDGRGQVSGDVDVPEWAGDGEEDVRAVGVNSDGERREVVDTAKVSDGQSWPILRWMLPIVAALFFALAAWLTWLARPSRLRDEPTAFQPLT
ncbi:MAG: VWA domain-containing protein [Microthrixaceae bacterium]